MRVIAYLEGYIGRGARVLPMPPESAEWKSTSFLVHTKHFQNDVRVESVG